MGGRWAVRAKMSGLHRYACEVLPEMRYRVIWCGPSVVSFCMRWNGSNTKTPSIFTGGTIIRDMYPRYGGVLPIFLAIQLWDNKDNLKKPEPTYDSRYAKVLREEQVRLESVADQDSLCHQHQCVPLRTMRNLRV